MADMGFSVVLQRTDKTGETMSEPWLKTQDHVRTIAAWPFDTAKLSFSQGEKKSRGGHLSITPEFSLAVTTVESSGMPHAGHWAHRSRKIF